MIEPETNVYVFAVFGLLIFPENYQPNQIDLVDDYLRWRLDNALSAKILIGIQKICLILNDCQVPLVNPLSLKGIFSVSPEEICVNWKYQQDAGWMVICKHQQIEMTGVVFTGSLQDPPEII